MAAWSMNDVKSDAFENGMLVSKWWIQAKFTCLVSRFKIIMPFSELGEWYLLHGCWNINGPYTEIRSPRHVAVVATQSPRVVVCYVLEAPIFIFHLLTNTFPSRDLPPYPLHHMTTSPDRLPIHFAMWFSLAMHVTHTDSYLVAHILGFTRESVRLGMTPYFVKWLLTSTGTSSIRLESWQLPRCI